jgi:hypothetical protein
VCWNLKIFSRHRVCERKGDSSHDAKVAQTALLLFEPSDVRVEFVCKGSCYDEGTAMFFECVFLFVDLELGGL